jgi:hypothetical protein
MIVKLGRGAAAEQDGAQRHRDDHDAGAPGQRADQRQRAGVAQEQAAADPRRFPALTAFIAAGVFEAADEPDDEFVFGLDRILDGVGVLVERITP